MDQDGKGEELTATVQYNLWANVISRVEFRWDHADRPAGIRVYWTPILRHTTNSYLLAAQRHLQVLI